MPTEQSRTKVLVVEDERLIADTLALILRGWGFEARPAYSGEDGAEIALAWRPDAVISDVSMAKMDGVALAILLAKALPECRTLLISGHLKTAHLLSESKKLGYHFPILQKPCNPDRIFSFLTSIKPKEIRDQPAQPDKPAHAEPRRMDATFESICRSTGYDKGC